jgi:hypothetical protein
MIVCAAIKIINEELYGVKLDKPEELIVCGHRHGNCLEVISQLGARWGGRKKIQGFINHKGEFLDRKEALSHALECGQLSATHRYYWEDHNINELYSEDLY